MESVIEAVRVATPSVEVSDREWFAVRVRSNFESTVGAMLDYKGVEQFLPTYRERRAWADRMKTIDVPLFPGYIFCRIDPNRRNDVLTVRGVVGIVGSGKVPVAVSPVEIESIRTAVQSHMAVKPCPFLRVGQAARIRSGPLAGVEGILTKVKNAHRIILSITLLQRSVAVEVDSACIARLN